LRAQAGNEIRATLVRSADETFCKVEHGGKLVTCVDWMSSGAQAIVGSFQSE
jgi:hypothetical protein